jgi:hypothetical protein
MAITAAQRQNKIMNVKTVDNAGIGRLKTLVMENTKNKKELIEELEGILKSNKDNIYCDEYQIADMIIEALKMYDV